MTDRDTYVAGDTEELPTYMRCAMSRYAMCPICGHRMKRVLDDFGLWDGESYTCEWCDLEYDDEDENISVYEAAEIWLSNGKDEDYMFGYSKEELEDAL